MQEIRTTTPPVAEVMVVPRAASYPPSTANSPLMVVVSNPDLMCVPGSVMRLPAVSTGSQYVCSSAPVTVFTSSINTRCVVPEAPFSTRVKSRLLTETEKGWFVARVEGEDVAVFDVAPFTVDDAVADAVAAEEEVLVEVAERLAV